MFGLGRKQEAHKRHDRADRQNNRGRQPQILFLDRGDERDFVGPPNIGAKPRAEQCAGRIAEAHARSPAFGRETLAEVRGDHSPSQFEHGWP